MTTLADFTAYDDLSRRTSVTLGNTTASAYSYGSQGTLAGLSHNLTGTAQDVTYGYARNQAQELISHTWSNDAYQWSGAVNSTNGTIGYTANGLNQYTTVAGAALSHDASGNLTGDGTWSWGYDADNQLKTASRSGTSVALAYDAAGRLRQEVLNGTTPTATTTQFLYDGVSLVAEYDGAGALLRRYVPGPGVDETLVAYQGSTTTGKEWLYADHLGSVVASANSTGSSTAAYAYGPFGEPSQTAGVRFRYTGQTLMPNLGLYYYKARFYSPTLGLFMQTDPIGYADDWNLYAYVGNDPVNGKDPSGLTVYLVGHVTGGPAGYAISPTAYHMAILLVPDNPAALAGISSYTLGGQPSQMSGGKLVSSPNYPGDSPDNSTTLVRVPAPAGVSDTAFIRSLVSTSSRYGNDLPYSYPADRSGAMPAGTYNSNSYVSGVLQAAGATPPALPTNGNWQAPGYANPIPIPTNGTTSGSQFGPATGQPSRK